MAAAYFLFGPLCVVPLWFLIFSTVRVIRHYRDSREHGKTPYRKYSRFKQVLTALLVLIHLVLLFDIDPAQWPFLDLLIRSIYFALSVLAWITSFLLVSFDATRQLDQSWLCQRGFWPFSCLCSCLSLVLQLKATAILHSNSPETESYFLISRCTLYSCAVVTTGVLTYLALQHPNDFFWTGSVSVLLSPRLLRVSRQRRGTADTRLTASITALKAKQGLVLFRISVKIGGNEHSTQRQFSEFRELHEGLRSNFSEETFPNLVFPNLPNVNSLEIEEKIAQLNKYLSALLIPELMTDQLLDFLAIKDGVRIELSALHEQAMKALGVFEPGSRHDSFHFTQIQSSAPQAVTRALYFSVIIESWEQSTDPDSHVNYLLSWQCIPFASQGKCTRRFNDFYSLHQALKSELSCDLPSFPKKNYLAGFGKALDQASLSVRKEALETYIRAVSNDPAYLSESTLRFLGCSVSRQTLWYSQYEPFEYSLFPPVAWEGEVDDQQVHYTVYILTFQRIDRETGANLQWKVSRRFREFNKLHQQLLSRLKSTAYLQHCSALSRPTAPALPPLPRKGLVALSSHQEIEQRRKALQTYIQDLLRVPHVFEAYALRFFLQEPGDLAPRESVASSELVLT